MRKWFLISAVVAALDLYSKHMVQLTLQYGEHHTVNRFFDWVRYHNTGAAFSFLADAGGWQKWFFSGISIIAIVVMAYLIKKYPLRNLFCFGLALVLGGAVGNLYDRLTLGYVVDFIYLHVGDFYWPAFNVADSAICVGVGLLLWDSFKKT